MQTISPMGLTLRVELDADRQPTVTPDEVGSSAQRVVRTKRKPTEIRRGSVTVKLYHCGNGAFIIPWYDAAGVRKLAMRSDRQRAVAFAELKANEMAKGESSMSNFGQHDRAEWLACLAAAAGTGVSLLTLVGEAVEARKKNAGLKFVAKRCPELVEELLTAKRAEKAGDRWVDDLDSRLSRFAKEFTGPLHHVRAEDVSAWLTRLKLGDRSWNNNRTALIALVKFAREANYVPAEWNALAGIKPFKIEKGEEELYTPEEMRALLFTAEKFYPQHLSALAIMGFAGCRHSELRDKTAALDWADVHLSAAKIRIREGVAKSNTGRRYAPMQPNLVAWLEPYVRPRGPVCEVLNLSNAFARLAERAQVKWKKNALRNSFISYRCALTKNIAQVASEAGNSVREIDDSYRQEIPEEEAARWFAIMPTKSDILPLFAHAAKLL